MERLNLLRQVGLAEEALPHSQASRRTGTVVTLYSERAVEVRLSLTSKCCFSVKLNKEKVDDKNLPFDRSRSRLF